MKKKNGYQVDVFPRNRQIIVESISASKYFNHVTGITDADVTKSLQIFENYRKKTGEQLSFTAWFMRCVAKAASEYPVIRTFRWKKWKSVIFDDVDIKCMIERVIDNRRIPIHYIFRKADKKSFEELHKELRAVQAKVEEKRREERKIKEKQRILQRLPIFFRRKFIWPSVIKNPFKHKEHLGVIGVSALGMFGKRMPGWIVPKTMHQTQFTIGSIVRKPVETKTGVKFKDFLNFSVTINHDIVDGGPGIDFAKRVVQLLQEGFELEKFAV
ncbi:MAG: 2-oxo acid dehydrogenase subunit E2 [Candidatus Heimdallarchaeota archaeon]|nr:2-oxo acid dehydrogenase subunit E2 [Candidatus Heimdallarchaeota archaeon]